MESIWHLSPQNADRLYLIAIMALCFGAILTLACLFALISSIAGQSKYLQLQMTLAQARTREADAIIAAAEAAQERLETGSASAGAPSAGSPSETAPRGARLLSDEQRATLARRLGTRLPAMQYKLAVASSEDPAARGFGLQLMQFFEDEGLSLIAQRNPRAPYSSSDQGAIGSDVLVKYKRDPVPEFAEELRDALAAAGIAAELRHDSNLNLEEVQLVALAS